ncbi:MAG: hypothetical protein EA422_12700 [Gemmatimonadales bacterium]|nr:MAG: hypothetical protein EA422_12700 [Gemmatimonadales bacterium]
MSLSAAYVVHLSGDLSRQAGRNRVQVLEPREALTAAELRRRVAQQVPTADPLVHRALVVAGDRILGVDEVVPRDRRISLVPPVSGG